MRLFIGFTILVTIANVFIFLHRNDYIYTKQSSYKDLYHISQNPSIKSIELANDSTLHIKLNNPSSSPVQWCVQTNNDKPKSYHSIEPVIALKSGIASYKVFSAHTDTFHVKVECPLKNYSKHLENSQNGGALIIQSDLPDPENTNNINRWKNHEIAKTTTDKMAIQAILRDSLHIKNTDQTFEKIKKLGLYLCAGISDSKGTPTDSVQLLPVFEQYKAALSDEKIWCGIYAQIFNLFANEAGIKTRYIEIRQPYNNIEGDVHVFNEYYLPELKKWAAIDIMFNNIAYVGAAGNLLNGVDVKNANHADSSIRVFQSYTKDSLIVKSYAQLDAGFHNYYNRYRDLYFYHAINPSTVYSFKEKLRRYTIEHYWYEVYSDTTVYNNRRFYIKQFLLLLELTLVILFGFTMVRKLIKKTTTL